MHFSDLSKWIGALGIVVLPGTAVNATCFVCDEVVEFDALRAACFMQEAEDYMTKAGQDGRVEIDLTVCTGAEAGGSRGLDAFPFFPGNDGPGGDGEVRGDPKLRTVYILDTEGVNCLHDILSAWDGPIDPTLTVDLLAECE